MPVFLPACLDLMPLPYPLQTRSPLSCGYSSVLPQFHAKSSGTLPHASKLAEGLASSEFSVLTQSCLTLCDPMDCSPPVSSVHGIFRARNLERVAISNSRGSSGPRDQTHVSCVSCTGGSILYHCAIWESTHRVPVTDPNVLK